MTPLFPAINLGMLLGHERLYIKDERQGPTGSFKDRQASVAISMMKQVDVTEAVVASTGNVAIAYSAYGARAGIKLWAFVPSSIPAEKNREITLYGTEVVTVDGTYDQTKTAAAQFARSKDVFLDSGIKGIAARESMKTMAFEIAEQLASIQSNDGSSRAIVGERKWQSPDWYVQAVSGGLGPVGVLKGFEELLKMGLIDKVPKIACFQVTGCSPMASAFKLGSATAATVKHPQTDILALATGDPGDAYQVLFDNINRYGGIIDSVSDAEAFHALHAVAKMEGLSIEPATAVAFAGLFKMARDGILDPEETVVINCSGHTFPVEKHILGDMASRNKRLTSERVGAIKEEGVLTRVEQLDDRVKSIAIIEDSPDASRLLRRILQAQGEYIIAEASDGVTGLNLIRESQPNLVILDLMMPGIDGFTLLDKMRADPELSDIPVIVITARDLTIGEHNRLRSNAARLFQKGAFLDTELVEDIKSLI